MGENSSNHNDQHLTTGNNVTDCSNIVGSSSIPTSASTMIKVEELTSSSQNHNNPSQNSNVQESQQQQQQLPQQIVVHSQSQPQDSYNNIHLPPSACTGVISSSSASSSSISSISSLPFNPSVEQVAIQTGGQPPQPSSQMFHHGITTFTSPGSTMNSTFNSSMSSLDRGSPTLSNNNINHNNNVVFNTADYLAQLLKDRKQLSAFPNVFHHVERLIDDEISKVRGNLFQINGTEKRSMVLPEPDGQVQLRTEKVYVPVKDFPDYNFVGRILGPRGMTAKQLEQETGCKIMVRGRGSMRDKKKEEANRGKPNWEHLSDELHVLITCEDTPNRAEVKLERAKEEVRKLLVPVTDGDDDLKKRQLMELAILNGTYRDPSARSDKENEQLMRTQLPGLMRHPSVASLGSPLILGPPGGMIRQLMTPGGVPSLMHGNDGHTSFLYDPYTFTQYPMSHLIAADFGSSTGQQMDSMSTDDKRKKRRLN